MADACFAGEGMTEMAGKIRKEKNRKEQFGKKAERKRGGGKPGFSTEPCGKLGGKPSEIVENNVSGRLTETIARRKKEFGLGYYRQLDFACPYYGWESKSAVHCDGGNVKLPNGAAAEEYFLTYCANVPGWRRCTVARAITRHLEKKYEELEMLSSSSSHIP